MKRIKVFLCLGALVLALSACGNDKSNSDQNQGGNQQSGAQNGNQNSGQTSGQNGDQNSSQNNGQNDNQNGNQNGDQSSSMSSGQNGSQNNGDKLSEGMQAVKDALVETLGDNYWPEATIPADLLEDRYGISPDMYNDYLAEMPLMSTKVDTIIVIQAKEDSVNAVEDALTKYRDKVVKDTLQYPMNVGKVQASRIERIGNYVCFVQLGGDTMDAMDIGDEEVIKHCQEQNELAITVIEQNIQHS